MALQLRNGPEWVAFDLAAHCLGLVPVPLYTEARPENAAYILGDAQCRLWLVQSAAQWRRLAPALTDLASLAAGRAARRRPLKLKRAAVLERSGEVVEGMYR